MHKSYWFIALLVLGGCEIVEGNGVALAVDHDVRAFDVVHSATTLETLLEVDPDAAPNVRVTCDENLHEELTVSVVGGELRLEQTDNVILDPRTECVIEITANDLEAIEVFGSGTLRSGALTGLEHASLTGSGRLELASIDSAALALNVVGSGSLRAEEVAVDDLIIDLEGSGDLRVESGASERVNATLVGSGSADLLEHQARRAVADLEGSGRVALSASERVEVRLHGSGSVEVLGDPDDREHDVTGSGSVLYR